MSFCDPRGNQLDADDLAPALSPVSWDDYRAIMHAVARDPETPDVAERLRLTYVLMDLADRAGVAGPAQ